jgi:hypothetical protein
VNARDQGLDDEMLGAACGTRFGMQFAMSRRSLVVEMFGRYRPT